MSRAIYPATHLSEAQKDAVRESAERAALIECARRTGRNVYLKRGADADSAKAGIKVVNSLADSEIVARQLLPFTDLALGANDIWGTGAMVAATELTFINHVLDEDEVVTIYGAAIDDANPSGTRLTLQQAATVIMARWDLTPLYAAEEPVGYSDEYIMWIGRDTVQALIWPRNTKVAPGDILVLLGYIAQPKGRVITK